MTEDGPEWKIEHVSGQNYEVISSLDYDATDVVMEGTNVAYPRVDFDPKRSKTWQKRFARFEAGARAALTLSPKQSSEPSTFGLTISWTDASGGPHSDWYRIPLPGRTRPDLRPPVPPGFATRAGSMPNRVSPRQYAGLVPDVDPREVFVVVGRNTAANDSMFTFLSAINLKPMEWSTAIAATGSGSPYIGDALEAAFARVKAVVVFMTPDDIAQLRPEYASDSDDPELKPTPQARPNVLFEAGMALGLHPNQTILVELGSLRSFTDVAGRHAIRIDNSPEKRGELANRLRNAGCDVDTTGNRWYRAGDFSAPKAPSGPTPAGRRLSSASPAKAKNRLDARYMSRASGSDKVQITNVGSEELSELRSQNTNEFHGHLEPLRVARLPVGKTATLSVVRASGHPDTWDLIVNGRTESGSDFSESLYLDLNT